MNNNLEGLLKMNLQLLASGGEAEQVENNNAEKEVENKTFTEEELNKRIQSESDKRVTEALRTAKEKWEKEYNEKLEKEKTEAEKLAKMTADERARAQFEKEKASFEEARQKFLRDQLELETVKELSKQGLNTEFSSFLMGENAEKTNENIKVFKEKFDEAVENAVNERLKGSTPKTSPGKSLTIQDIEKMTPEEINRHWDVISQIKF